MCPPSNPINFSNPSPSTIILARTTISRLDHCNCLFNGLSMSIFQVTVYPEIRVIFLEHGSEYVPFLLKLYTFIRSSDLATDHFSSLVLRHLTPHSLPLLLCISTSLSFLQFLRQVTLPPASRPLHMLFVPSAWNVSHRQPSSAWWTPTYPSALSSRHYLKKACPKHPLWLRALSYTQVKPPALLLSRAFASVCKHILGWCKCNRSFCHYF